MRIPYAPRPVGRPGQHWSEADDERLAALWAEGLSGRLIGKEMGRTRGGVLGRAARLKLTKRPRSADDVLPLPPLVVVRPVQLPLLPVPVPPGAKRVPLTLRLVPTTAPRECQWPLGGESPYWFCNAPAVEGRPYCGFHCSKAYIGFGRPAGHAWVAPS